MYNAVITSNRGVHGICGGDAKVPIDNLNNLLMNIGRTDTLLSEEEMASLLQDVGATSRFISKDDMMQLVVP